MDSTLPTDSKTREAWKLDRNSAEFGKFLEGYRPLIEAIAKKNGLRDTNDIEDIIQKVFYIVIKDSTYKPERPFKPWLSTVVRRAAIDAVSKNTLPQESEDFPLAEIAADKTPDVLSSLIRNEESQLLNTFLDSWSNPQDVAMLRAFYMEGLSTREVGERFGVGQTADNYNAVSLRLHRLKAALQTAIANEVDASQPSISEGTEPKKFTDATGGKKPPLARGKEHRTDRGVV